MNSGRLCAFSSGGKDGALECGLDTIGYGVSGYRSCGVAASTELHQRILARSVRDGWPSNEIMPTLMILVVSEHAKR